MKVAVIDDGINIDYYKSVNCTLGNYVVTKNNIVIEDTLLRYLPSHGTTCAAIIKNYASEAELISIKVIKEDGGNVKGVGSAINWCIDNDIHLVSLSIGTKSFWDFGEVKKIIDWAYSRKIIVVAACNNHNTLTYPACLEKVISVKSDAMLIKDQFYFIKNPYNGVDIAASSSHELTLYNDEIIYTPIANSFAAPLITAKIHNILQNELIYNVDRIKEKLNIISNNTILLPISYDSFPDEEPEIDIDIPIITISYLNNGKTNSDCKNDLYLYIKSKDPQIQALLGKEINDCSRIEFVDSNIITNIIELFRINGYYAVGILECTYIVNSTRKIEMFHKGDMNYSTQLKWYYKKYMCDIFFCGISLDNPIKSLADVNIFIGDFDSISEISSNYDITKYKSYLRTNIEKVIYDLIIKAT